MKKIIVFIVLALVVMCAFLYSEGKILSKTDSFGHDRYIGRGCEIYAGCNGSDMCGEAGQEGAGSICMPYAGMQCYEKSFARCEKQLNGKCGWTQTEEFQQCIDTARASENYANTSIGKNSIFSVNLEGYKQTCSSNVNIYKFEDDYFVKAENEPVSFHYIDDELATNYCDVVECKKIDSPYVVKLFDYKKIGEKVVPKDETSRLSGLKLPVYHPEILKGTLKIDINYFSDSKCEIPKTFSKTIEN